MRAVPTATKFLYGLNFCSSRTTETIYRHELRPVITTGADVMDRIFV